MIPRRRLNELKLMSDLEKRKTFLILEGRSDAIILRTYLTDHQSSTHIYTIADIECEEVNSKGFFGNKGRIFGASECMSEAEKNIVCIIDRDGDEFQDFWLNKNCITTDFSSLEIYGFDLNKVIAYINNYYDIKLDGEIFSSLIDVSKKISHINWVRIKEIPDKPLANFVSSLSFDKRACRLGVDLPDWLKRSASSGGERSKWLSLEEKSKKSRYAEAVEWKEVTNVHVIDKVIRYTILALKNNSNHIEGWLERHLRANTKRDDICEFKFFQEIELRCEQNRVA